MYSYHNFLVLHGFLFFLLFLVFFLKQKTAYEMRISDWSSDVCSSDLASLGPDGHAARGGFLPPIPLPRRMWAGSRVAFPRPLEIGSATTRHSTIKSVEEKAGRSGRLAFVTVEHVIAAVAGTCIVGEHDLVYREDGEKAAALPKGEGPPSEDRVRPEGRPCTGRACRRSASARNRQRDDAPLHHQVGGGEGRAQRAPRLRHRRARHRRCGRPLHRRGARHRLP